MKINIDELPFETEETLLDRSIDMIEVSYFKSFDQKARDLALESVYKILKELKRRKTGN